MNKFYKIYTCLIHLQYWKAYLKLVSPLFELDELVKKLGKVDNLIDVGSNKGQLSLLVRNYNKKCRIYSFEPQTKFLEIQKKLINYNIKFYDFCLGNKNFKTNFYITKRKDSSSLLKPIYFKKTKYKIIDKININVHKLDSIVNIKTTQKNLIKLDVQGYEMQVLMGASKLLNKIDYVIVEISTKKIYHNQINYINILNFLSKKKFKLIKVYNKVKLKDNIYQADYFFKKLKKNKN